LSKINTGPCDISEFYSPKFMVEVELASGDQSFS